MEDKHSKRPRDLNQAAKLVVDIASGQVDDAPHAQIIDHSKDSAAVSIGRRGGLKGGRVRAERLTDQERVDIAKKGAAARWKK